MPVLEGSVGPLTPAQEFLAQQVLKVGNSLTNNGRVSLSAIPFAEVMASIALTTYLVVVKLGPDELTMIIWGTRTSGDASDGYDWKEAWNLQKYDPDKSHPALKTRVLAHGVLCTEVYRLLRRLSMAPELETIEA